MFALPVGALALSADKFAWTVVILTYLLDGMFLHGMWVHLHRVKVFIFLVRDACTESRFTQTDCVYACTGVGKRALRADSLKLTVCMHALVWARMHGLWVGTLS